MTEEPFYSPKHVIPKRQPQPGELLCEFVRGSDGAPMSIELRAHGENLFEVQLLERGEFYRSRSGFATRALAVNWAELERESME